MAGLHMEALLVVVFLAIGNVLPEPHHYAHQYFRGPPSGYYGGGVTSFPSVAHLIGKPAKIVTQSGRHRYGGIPSPPAEVTFGVSSVPSSSFAVPGSASGHGTSASVIRRPSPVVQIPGNQISSHEVTGSGGATRQPNNAATATRDPAVTGGLRVGSCPPVRYSCTTFRSRSTRSSGLPSCSTDDTCPQGNKCCFDACVQRNICKSTI